MKKSLNDCKTIHEEAVFELSQKYNLPYSVIEIICTFPFKKLKELQQKGSTLTLMFKSWGKYFVRPKRQQRIQEYKKSRKNTLIAQEMSKEQRIDI